MKYTLQSLFSLETLSLPICLLVLFVRYVRFSVSITNSFQNIDEASEADRQYKLKLRETSRLAKREIFLQKQRQDLSQLVAQVHLLDE